MRALAYSRPSALASWRGGQLLGLETAGGSTPRGFEPHPRFFAGFLASPRIGARGLLCVADVAAARYYQRAPLSSLDPVVTGNGDRLRFESFEREAVKPGRLADAARTAAGTGAYRTVLSVLVPVLPALLARARAPGA